MEQKNIIYPEKESSLFKDPKVIVGVVLLVILAGLWWKFGIKEPKPEIPPEPPKAVSLQSGYFTVSSNPSRISFTAGNIKPKEVTIKVIPFEGFSEPITFRVASVLKNGLSVEGISLSAAFPAENILAPEDFSNGIILSITPTKGIVKGTYLVSYSAESQSIKKGFRVPIIIE